MTTDTFASLLNSDQVTPPTRKVLAQREAEDFSAPSFFNADEFDLLRDVCDCLLAQNTENRLVDVAGFIDKRLAEKSGPGWRYNQLPADGTAYQTGLKGISESVILLHHKNFNELSSEEKNDLLKTVQNGNAPGETWKNLESKLFFELLLTDATEQFYSAPAAQAEINYTGFADAKGWQVPEIKP